MSFYIDHSQYALTLCSTLDIHHVVSELEASIGQYVHFEVSAGSPITKVDSVDCAFFLCLYAVSYARLSTLVSSIMLNTIQYKDLSSHMNPAVAKPYIETCLLALVDVIMHPASIFCEGTPGSIVRGICFRWGNLVPWCWRTWGDSRLANAEVTIAVVRV